MLLQFIFFFVKIFTFLFLIGIAIAAFLFYHYSHDLPNYDQLDKYHPPSITRIYSADGQLMEEYAREHRIFIPIGSIPKPIINAFVAAEDKNFYYHTGIDILSIARAILTNISHIVRNKRIEGGSTITQQVVKNFLLTSERSLERKIKEAILAYMVSNSFSKEKILELYLNQIYLGKGAYGVATASLIYFNKSVEQLTLNEAATLAAMPKAPSKFDPERNYPRAFQRKNYVLNRMYDDGYITEQECSENSKLPIKILRHQKSETLNAKYYAETVREEVINMFGNEYFYTAGLSIFTCADSKIQQAAANALRFGIRRHDTRMGYRGPITHISLIDWENKLQNIPEPQSIREYKISTVLEIEDGKARIGLKDGNTANIFLKDTKWAKENLTSLKQLLKTGDVVIVEPYESYYKLKQIPQVNGGIMVLENGTGRVLAAEGGYDYNSSKFDRTTQAKRQPGSLIKPFVYLSALESGAKPNDIFEDAEIEIVQGQGLPLWKPKNYERDFLGPVTLRKGLEKSRNTVTVRVGLFAGLPKVIEVIKRFGINNAPIMVPSILLGSIETNLSKMVLAYGTIANGGQQIESHYIEMIKDRNGKIIYKRDYTEYPEYKSLTLNEEGNIIPPKLHIPVGKTIIDEASSYQLISLMIGSVQRGTSRGAKTIQQIVAGKTGTTNLAKDAWFIGFTPKMIIGTYIGYDNPRSLGKRASGASIALPVFVNFMENGYKNFPSVDFIVPDSINLALIDYDTGQLSTEKGAIIEAFRAETLPSHDQESFF